jgi:polysaccharide deacetylase family protein (PEP-CTERM system associated)
MRHAFTVDLEDWYHGIPIDTGLKAGAERRLHVGTDVLLELLARHGSKATFFCLSPTAREHPQLVRRVADAGHEIGSHGESHDLVYTMTRERFREETRRSIRELEDCCGRKVQSYRAAYFSITERSLWALEVLRELGIAFDSSIFPVRNWRYGIPGYSRRPLAIDTAHGRLLEFPISTRRLFGRNLPATGGAYFRIYPYRLTRANLRAIEQEGFPAVFYLHPWELDPDHPRVQFPWKPRLTHYVNLGVTRSRLERLLAEFNFTTLPEVLLDAVAGTRQ